ncbi:MAG: putative phage abortive infection protein [Bacteroidales bacterium]|nr:putative phage abortive infection protein [Bacteroidales bacterium]
MKQIEWIKKYSVLIISIVSFLVILGLWIFNWAYLKDLSDVKRGTFGDMFGMVNSLFSGLALTGIIITIILQSKELGLQRKELSDTRLEFNIQNHTLKLQRFENTFFNLISIHHQIVNSIDYDVKERLNPFDQVKGKIPQKDRLNGRDVFKYRYDELSDLLSNWPDKDEINKVYLKFYEKVQTDFGHYFRNLYRIIKFVDNTQFLDSINSIEEQTEEFKIKYNYTCMIRAQLSDYELLWLFYNCLSDNGIEKFKPYIEQYTLFKNIPTNKISNTNHVELYEPSAYRKIEL